MSKPTFSFQVAEKAALSCATLQSQMTRWRRLLPTLAAQQRGMWFLVVASRCHPHCTSGSTSVGKVNKPQSRKDQPNWLVSRCKLTRSHVADTPGTRVTRARGPRDEAHCTMWNGHVPSTSTHGMGVRHARSVSSLRVLDKRETESPGRR